MEILKDSEVSYTPLAEIILPIIAEYIGLSETEIKESGWGIDAYIAEDTDIISFVNDGFSNEVTRQEANELAGKLVCIDLEGLPMDYDTYQELIESTDLYNKILTNIQKNGYPEIIDIHMK
jgi:hypothetical protein